MSNTHLLPDVKKMVRLPPDHEVIRYLREECGFTKVGAKRCLKVFKETMRFAGLLDETQKCPSCGEEVTEG